MSYLLYIVYSKRILKRRLNLKGKDNKVYKYLLTALKFRRLEAIYKELIKAAKKATRNNRDFNYV